jgi:hypothetical protein
VPATALAMLESAVWCCAVLWLDVCVLLFRCFVGAQEEHGRNQISACQKLQKRIFCLFGVTKKEDLVPFRVVLTAALSLENSHRHKDNKTWLS